MFNSFLDQFVFVIYTEMETELHLNQMSFDISFCFSGEILE